MDVASELDMQGVAPTQVNERLPLVLMVVE